MYKQARSFEERCSESRTMLNRYSDRVPVIIEPKGNAPEIDKRKYMAPKDITFSQLIYVVRKRLLMQPDQALFFLLSDRTLVTASSTLGDLYTRHVDEDGFLYVSYTLENTFG